MSDENSASKKPKITDASEQIEFQIAKSTNSVLEASEQSKTCKHWVKRKKRFCKMTVAKAGKDYCGEHEPTVNEADAPTSDNNNRIPCPLDAKHSVYKHKLQKHLKICNAREKDEQPDYLVKNINAGTNEADDTCAEIGLDKLKLNELPDEEFYALVNRIKELYHKYVQEQIKTKEIDFEMLREELATLEEGKEAKKHLLQTSALLGILQEQSQLAPNSSYIEFGAGKGQLAFYLAQTLQKFKLNNSQVLLVDRMSLRHKKDNKIEDKALVQRIRADIADLCLSKIEILRNSERHVAVSKHLCGVATDLTLRCITQCAHENNFIMIALCCHHRCDWTPFVGKPFFKKHELGQKEFVIFTKMASWSVCGTGMSRERRKALEQQNLTAPEIAEINIQQRLQLNEREEIGLMCKRLLDYARMEFLRELGYDVELCYYISRNITLENVCLLAKKCKNNK